MEYSAAARDGARHGRGDLRIGLDIVGTNHQDLIMIIGQFRDLALAQRNQHVTLPAGLSDFRRRRGKRVSIDYVVHQRSRKLGRADVYKFELGRIAARLRYQKSEDLFGGRSRAGGAEGSQLRQSFEPRLDGAFARETEFV